MSRKRCQRRAFVALPPRGLRPRLDNSQRTDLAITHLQVLDAIARGQADEQVLWDLIGAAFTWSRVADRLGIGVIEARTQLELATRVCERYGRTGRVLFTGTEYQAAKVGVDVMDQLAAIVDRPTAIEAADWSEQQLQRIARLYSKIREEAAA